MSVIEKFFNAQEKNLVDSELYALVAAVVLFERDVPSIAAGLSHSLRDGFTEIMSTFLQLDREQARFFAAEILIASNSFE